MAELTPEEIRGLPESITSPWRQLLAVMEENERQTDRSVTLEGIVRRLRTGWEPTPRPGDVWLWVTADFFMEDGVPYAEEPCTDAEALILKEMQQ